MNQPINESNKSERDDTETKHKQQLMDGIQTELDDDIEESPIAERILAINHLQVFEIELSYGGPTEWLQVYGRDREIVEVTHHYSFGSEYKEVNLSASEVELMSTWINRYLPSIPDQISSLPN